MLKKLTSLLCIVAISIGLIMPASAHFSQELSAECSILYCADTGDVLYERNADREMLIASLTKIMTAIVIIENCDLNAEFTPKPEWCAIEGSSMYLDYTKSYTVKEVLTGLLLVSGNDAATALARYCSGDERSFSAKMNEKANALGLTHTSFRNPHGLDDDEHYSSARDLAVLTAYCMENPEFAGIVSRYSATVKDNTYYNHNKLLINYKGCIGVKTGYTMAAGRTLISCAERNGMRLICVTLNAPDDWNDHTKLLNYGFESYSINSYSPETFKLSIPVISGVRDRALAVPDNDIRLLINNADDVKVSLDMPKIIFAGALEGEKVGYIRVFVNGELAGSTQLVYTEDVPIDYSAHLTVFEQMKRLLDFGTKPFYTV